jgi:two-component system OmpR family response regulator
MSATLADGAEMPKVLIVDDDSHIREVVRFALAKDGFETTEAGDGVAALEVFEATCPDLVILDITMPEMDGTDVCRHLRGISAVPVIFLSSRDEEVDRIVGLELGADDYVSKPFSPRELVARVRAVLRRARATSPAGAPVPTRLEHGLVRLDLEGYQAFWGETALDLTRTEFEILLTLTRRPGRVFSRDVLMDEAYPGHRVVSDRTIDSHVRRLRAKLREAGGDPIETVHGRGYKLGDAT